MRGRSYSPSPPRGYSRRGRSPNPRGHYGGRSRDAPTSLLVRNLRLDCRPDDLRRPFGQFGPVKDIYLPRDYYTGEPRGFGFVQYVDPADAADAKYEMDGYTFQGRPLTVVFAEENRKKPQQMRARERSGRSGDYDSRRRSSARYSCSPRRHVRLRSSSDDYYSPPPKRRYSRSISPQEWRYSRERSYSQSPPRRDRSPPPPPPYEGSRSRGRSPVREQSRSCSGSPVMLSPGRGRGRSPNAEHVYSPSPRGYGSR